MVSIPEKVNLSELIKLHSTEVQRIEKLNAINEFYKSLISAVESAGGGADWLNEGTTLKELSDKLAINNVRFVYTPKRNINDFDEGY